MGKHWLNVSNRSFCHDSGHFRNPCLVAKVAHNIVVPCTGLPIIRGVGVSGLKVGLKTSLKVGLKTGLKVGLTLGLIAAAFLLPRWFDSPNDEEIVQHIGTCNLQQGGCDWQQQGQNWRLSLSDITTGRDTEANYRLDIIAPGAPQPLLAVLRGESMYMGEYPVPLVRDGNGYYAEFAAPFCTTGDAMIWRIDLQKGMKPLAQQPPFKIVFQAK